MELYEILLGVICGLLFIAILQLSSLISAFKGVGTILSQELGKDFGKSQEQRADILEELYGIRESTRDLHQIQSDLSEMK